MEMPGEQNRWAGKPTPRQPVPQGPERQPERPAEVEEDRAPVSAFDIVIDKRLTVTQGGVPREVTAEEALQHRTYQDAVAGNRAARRQVLKMIEKREQHLAAQPNRNTRQYEFRTEIDPDNADAALLILGIAVRDHSSQGRGYEGDLRLEPWAVQAALSRRRGGSRLTARDVAEIKRCTRDAGSLRWPRGTGE